MLTFLRLELGSHSFLVVFLGLRTVLKLLRDCWLEVESVGFYLTHSYPKVVRGDVDLYLGLQATYISLDGSFVILSLTSTYDVFKGAIPCRENWRILNVMSIEG